MLQERMKRSVLEMEPSSGGASSGRRVRPSSAPAGRRSMQAQLGPASPMQTSARPQSAPSLSSTGRPR